MPQDTTYQTTVYDLHGGSEKVVDSAGTITVASGGTISVSTGGSIVVDSGGTLRLLSGAGLSMESSVNWGLAGADLACLDARKILVSFLTPYSIVCSTGNSYLADSNLPRNVKFVTIYGHASMVSASFWLTSVSAGQECWLFLRGDSTGAFGAASTQIDVSTSGCILIGSVGAAISGFEMHTSLASDCGVHLIAPLDDVWAIVNQFGDIDE